MADGILQFKMQMSNRKTMTQKSKIPYQPSSQLEWIGREKKMQNEPNPNGRTQNTGDRKQKKKQNEPNVKIGNMS